MIKKLTSVITNLKNEVWIVVPLFSRYMVSSAGRMKYSRIIMDGIEPDEDRLLTPAENGHMIMTTDLGEVLAIDIAKLVLVCFTDTSNFLGQKFKIKYKDGDIHNRSASNMSMIPAGAGETSVYDLIHLSMKDRHVIDYLKADDKDMHQTIMARLLFKNNAYIFLDEVSREEVYTPEVMEAKQVCIDQSVTKGVFQVGNIYEINIFKPMDRLTFGKHKGKTLSEVRKLDPDHLKWINRSMPHAQCNIKL